MEPEENKAKKYPSLENTAVISVRVSKETAEAVKSKAEQHDQTRSEFVTAVLEEAVKDDLQPT